ncbi:hypothetical protein H0H93_008302 [Arthromyces matolae]|nr:hypothetical protein H0H93_008302 [Arthromyces matolae]
MSEDTATTRPKQSMYGGMVRYQGPHDIGPRALEPEATMITGEKKYYCLDEQYGIFIKRSLSPDEYMVDDFGKPCKPPIVKERLMNEVATIAFLKHHTTIPLPNVRCAFEDHERYYVILDWVPGVSLSDIEPREHGPILQELYGYRRQLLSLRSKMMGGITGHVCLPYRLAIEMSPDEVFRFREAETPEFVFTHNDLARHNIIVDPETHKINAIIDWEYAGFYPPDFEAEFYRRDGPSVPLDGDVDDVSRLLERDDTLL